MARPLAKPPDIGASFHLLTVVSDRFVINTNGVNRSFVSVICKCGEVITVKVTDLIIGKKKSCGCYKSLAISKAQTTRGGLSRTREYRSWAGMIDRCYDPNCEMYKRYGGRGITVCSTWIDSPQKFVSDMGKCPSGFSIERINNNGNYEPSNCKWATSKEQSNNRSSCLLFNINGKSMTLKGWCEVYGMNYGTVWSRMQIKGATVIDALTRPYDKKQQQNSLKRKRHDADSGNSKGAP